ncbi:MAG: cupin domain-containing protein [Vicinamibacterales bacterium]
MSGLTADAIIKRLGLQPHPEGGHYAETWRDPAPAGGRAHSTGIYYLLQGGNGSRWHRVDAAEMWHYYAGAPLALRLSADGAGCDTRTLGLDFEAGARPQIVVPAGWWQSALSLGAWTLVGCTVAPGFTFEGFEMAEVGWEPHGIL